MRNQREEEDGRVVYVKDETDAGHGPLSPGEGELGSRETDSNDSLLSTIEKSTDPAPNGTREVCVGDTRQTDDGQETDATASDSRESNCSINLPPAEGEHEKVAGDGAGEPETTALAALSVGDNSPRRAESSLNGDATASEGHSMAELASLRPKLDGSHNWRAPVSREKVPSPETSPACSGDSTGIAVDTDDASEQGGDGGDEVAPAVGTGSDEAMGADDFLPLFALVLVSCVEVPVVFFLERFGAVLRTSLLGSKPYYCTACCRTLFVWFVVRRLKYS